MSLASACSLPWKGEGGGGGPKMIPTRTASQSDLPFSRGGIRKTPLNWILRIVIAGRSRMAGSDEAVHERLVLPGECHIQPVHMVVPLRLGARACHDAGHQHVVEHPRDREMRSGHAAFVRILFELLRRL